MRKAKKKGSERQGKNRNINHLNNNKNKTQKLNSKRGQLLYITERGWEIFPFLRARSAGDFCITCPVKTITRPLKVVPGSTKNRGNLQTPTPAPKQTTQQKRV